MKYKVHHPEYKKDAPQGPRYWKSLDEVADTPAFKQWLHREFPQGAAEANSMDRRSFLKVMAASFAFAGFGLTGCRQPTQNILPYSKPPEAIIPGIALFYATSFPEQYENIPLIVETHDGRPTKIEGNPSCLTTGGATNVAAQASILDLYDPDRSYQSSNAQGETLSTAAVLDILKARHETFKKTQGHGLAVLAQPSTSPSRARLVEAFKATFPQAQWVEYTPVDMHNGSRALESVTGVWMRPIYNFKVAKRILSIDCDFLKTEPGNVGYTRSFTAARKISTPAEASNMLRLYMAESQFSLTGGMADHRLRLSSCHLHSFITALAAYLLPKLGAPSNLIAAVSATSVDLKIPAQWLEACAQDLMEHAGSALITVGSHLPEPVHVLAYVLNAYLQAPGTTLKYVEIPQSKADTVDQLIESIQQKSIQTLVLLDTNPTYSAPGTLNWEALQKQIPEVIHYGMALNESAQHAQMHIAGSHYLEAWSDGRTWDGTYVPVQPMILPLFETFAELEILEALIQGASQDAYTTVRETFKQLAPQASFEQWLAEGILAGSAFPIHVIDIDTAKAAQQIQKNSPVPYLLSRNNLEVRIVPSTQVGDGRFSNNGWLQEAPDPMTKVCWDNVICIGPKLAKELETAQNIRILPKPTVLNDQGVLYQNTSILDQDKEHAWLATLTIDGVSVTGPLHVQPGLADYTTILTLGYGRKNAGRIGNEIGFSAYPLLSNPALGYRCGATLRITDQHTSVANTQSHWSMEGRAIVREATLEGYQKSPNFVNEIGLEAESPPPYGIDTSMSLQKKSTLIPQGSSLYKTPDFTGIQQWGMVIDLNSCTGCNACVIACQSENNIPIVGADQVKRGREMHWIRLDRYYSSENPASMEVPEDPQVSFMGMLCQHCELAPCETVCPVNATVHNEEGLNVMTYNRCVGTRYCANNCPYKVRRFNFFDWNKRQIGHFYEGPLGPSGMEETQKMQKNPNVTVRMRGVMEKCTYCVQRIEEAKITQRNRAKASNNINVPDGTIRTACQQVCPAEAIAFGDISDAESQVSKLKDNDRNYSVLGYLNTRPRTTYLARLRNPNPNMPDYYAQPLTTAEYEKRSGNSSSAH